MKVKANSHGHQIRLSENGDSLSFNLILLACPLTHENGLANILILSAMLTVF